MGVDPRLIELVPADQTVVAICYLDHLTQGHTILGYRTRYSTLLGYMNTMAAWVQGHTGRDIRIQQNLAIPSALWLPHPMFKVIYDDTKHWQGIPNRQDPVSKSMITYLMDSMVGKDPHCLVNALIDFLIMGTQTGWRGVEWAQPVDPTINGFFLYDKKSSRFENMIYACCIEDFVFKRANGTTVPDPTKALPATVASCRVRWRFQKNLQHGEWIEFAGSPLEPTWCFVRAGLRVYKRFVELCNKPHTPVALYRRNLGSKKPTWLVKKSIESNLRFAAWKVFYPDEKYISGSLAKITLHSIRIMAAMLLFEAKATDLMVMGRLRYLSTAFQMYYRNTPALAKIHARAMESSGNYTPSAMPTEITDDEFDG